MEGQWGLVTRAQALQAGIAWSTLSRLASRDGALERVAHGVYRLRGSADPDHLSLRAAWLRLDPAVPAWDRLAGSALALVSHASVAALYDVGDLRADIHEFTLPVRRQTRRPDVRLHRGRVPGRDWLVLHGLPATRAGRMIADLLADHNEPAAVAQGVRGSSTGLMTIRPSWRTSSARSRVASVWLQVTAWVYSTCSSPWPVSPIE